MTSGKEDYLKALYTLSDSYEIITNKQLADTLQVSPPSVSEMIVKLEKQGYVEYTAYKGSRMTLKGKSVAAKLIRFHCIWEVFLVEVLGFSWREAHLEAEGLEHATSDVLAERLYEKLGRPAFGPDGTAIPDKQGNRPLQGHLAISELAEGDSAVISWFEDDMELMDYLQAKEIAVNLEILIMEKEPYEGSILLHTNKGDITISHKAAKQVYVRRCEVEPV